MLSQIIMDNKLLLLSATLILSGFVIFFIGLCLHTSFLFSWVILIFAGTVCLAIAKYEEQKNVIDAIMVGGISLAIVSLLYGFYSSRESLRKIEEALYPQDFKVSLFPMKSRICPDNQEITLIPISEKKLSCKHYGFKVVVENTSSKYPAENVFVRVFFEKSKFVIGEQERGESKNHKEKIKTEDDNEEILKAIYKKWSKPAKQGLTVDPLMLPPKITGKAGNMELIGIGFVLGTIWTETHINFYLPIDVYLKEDKGVVAIMVNEKMFIFKYVLQNSET